VRRTPALVAFACTAAAMLLPTTPAVADAEHEAIEALNEVRRAHGVRPLRAADGLNRSSQRYARRMIEGDFFGHAARIDVDGGFRTAGETLAWHTGWDAQPRKTIPRWMNSPGHRALLLSPRFGWVGMGLARGKFGSRMATTWVAHVGAR
jgi:uncharacterized protein YkwD